MKTTQKVIINISWASPGQKVWITLPAKDAIEEVYRKGEIVNIIDNETLSVKYHNSPEPFNIKGDKVFPCANYDSHPNGFDDMIDIENLSEAELLHNIQLKFASQQIFTYVGPTLIVVNPYKYIKELFDQKALESYQNAANTKGFELKDHKPHIYAISGAAIRNLTDNKKPQAIVISGESGAGKTETAKYAMKFLTSITKKMHTDSSPSDHKNIEDKILACNPIMETFGNAKTVRNDNSSRFGKYVSLLVEKESSRIVGATITNYLLEKSRICVQASEERNYHIFYALLMGETQQELNKYFLVKDLNQYEWLKNGYTGPVKGVPDVESFKEVVESFQMMGFSNEEQKAVWSFVASTLLLGNLAFKEGRKDDNQPCRFENESLAKNITTLLGLDYENFGNSLLYKTRTISGEVIQSVITKEECLSFKNSFAKELYNRLFTWLVKRLNYTVMPADLQQKDVDVQKQMENYYHIGLLDIFGFEILIQNSLEQLFINFANEKLQQLYIEYVFKAEEKEFVTEGLKNYLSELIFKDNQPLLDMIDKVNPPGIFQMVDEVSSINSNDQLLCDKITKACMKPNMPFTTPRLARDAFIVKHTAKDVEYQIGGFREKNKDELTKVIEDNMKNSSFGHVSAIWKNICFGESDPELASPSKQNPRDKFLGFKFRTQMRELMEELQKCECHFVRCIKPNEVKEPGLITQALALKQITYMGILDTIKIRKENYPIRRSFKAFYQRYIDLDPKAISTSYQDHVKNGSNFRELSQMICKKWAPNLDNNVILFGESKILMKLPASEALDKARHLIITGKNKAAKRFQKGWFRYKQLKKFRLMLKGIKLLQKTFRAQGDFKKYRYIRQCTIKIQRFWRRILAERLLQKQKDAMVIIEKWWKSLFQRRKYLRIVHAAKGVNRYWRGALARKEARKIRCVEYIIEKIIDKGVIKLFRKVQNVAVVDIQRWVRGHQCRCLHYPTVLKIRKAKRDFRAVRSAYIIQRNARGYLARRTIKRMRRAAFFIQGFIKMKWLSSIFNQLRIAAIIIQRAFRRWSIKRKTINNRLKEFLEAEANIYETTKMMEQMVLFGFLDEKKEEKPEPRTQGFKIDNPDLSANRSQIIPPLPYERVSLSTHQIGTARNNSTIVGLSGYMDNSVLQNSTLYNGLHDFSSLNKTRNVTPYSNKRINVFMKVIDTELLTDVSDIYEPLWSIQTLQLQNDCVTSDADLQVLEVGQAHSVAISNVNRVYSAGWNDRHQLGRPTLPQESTSAYAQVPLMIDNFRPKQVASGDDHTLLTDYQGNLYSWGDNSKGQLGLGRCLDVPEMVAIDFPGNESIKEIRAKGNSNLVVTNTGKAYYWPLHLNTGETIAKPSEVLLPPKIQAATIACGVTFAVIVAKNGLVFSFGRENLTGELGHGDTYPRESPTLIESLKEDGAKVTDVACGYKHVICKTANGKVYSWGWGEKGQLGHGTLSNELTPRMLSLASVASNLIGPKTKTLQVQAGYKHSVVLLESKRLVWFGSNSSIEEQCVPVEVNLSQKVPNMNPDFHVLRVMCTWSRSLNVTYVTIADTRTVPLNLTVKQKVLTTLTAKMEENYAFNDVDPPFVDSISKHFSAKAMKNMPITKEKKNLHSSPRARKLPLNKLTITPSPSQLFSQQLRPRDLNENPYLLSHVTEEDSLEKSQSKLIKNTHVNMTNYDTFSGEKIIPKNSEPGTSPSFRERIENVDDEIENIGVNAKEEELSEGNYTSRQLEQMSDKLLEIKQRMDEITKLPNHEWTEADVQFMEIALDPKVFSLLQNIKN